MRKWILAVILGIAGAAVLWPSLKAWRSAGFESSGKGYLQAYVINQKSWRQTYGFFAETRRDVQGNTPDLPSGYTLFVSKNELPPEYLSVLSEDELPFLAKDSFRILLAVRHKYQPEIFFWIADENDLRELSSRMHLRE